MEIAEMAKDFAAAPTKELLEKLTELVKANPTAAVAVVGILGIAFVSKIGMDNLNQK